MDENFYLRDGSSGDTAFAVVVTPEHAGRASRATVVYVETDPLAPVPSSEDWWDVPVSQVSALQSTQKARVAYEAAKRGHRLCL